jgi:tryptophan synthase alpha subunit
MPPESGIELSIVVALVSGAKQRLRTCLEALEAQRFDGMEIIVPYDDPVADVVELSAECTSAKHFGQAGRSAKRRFPSSA